MCMTTESGSVGSNASLVMSEIFGQVFVELQRTDLAADPFEDEVDGGNDLDLAGIGIERVFARQHRVSPDAAAAVQDQFAVAVLLAGDVAVFGPV